MSLVVSTAVLAACLVFIWLKNGRTSCFIMGLLLLPSLMFAATDEQAVVDDESEGSPPNIGNFALPGPQQPGPFLSFGQTLIGRNYLQVSLDTYSPFPVGGAFDKVNATMTYGITDSTSLYFNYPIEADVVTRTHRMTGLLNIVVQLEQAVYTVGNKRYQDQGTIVGALTVPMNEVTTNRFQQGYDAPAYFLGGTFNRTYVDWLGFVSPGVQITSTSKHIRLGSQVLYQAGLGRDIFSVSDKSILFGLLEVDGQYTQRDRVFGHELPNTGGNVVSVIPSLWLSTQNLIVQAGIGFPVVQNLYGNQTKMDYFIAGNVSWTIK